MSTGLRERVRELLIEPMADFERWFRSSLYSKDPSLPAARMAARGVLGIGINALQAIGVPRPAASVPPPVALVAGGTYTAGSFQPFQWTVTLPSDLAAVAAKPPGAGGLVASTDLEPRDVARFVLAEYANTVAHECRHCEQVFRITQWVYLRAFEERRDIYADAADIYLEKFVSTTSRMRKPAAPPSLQKAVQPAVLTLSRVLGDLAKGTEAADEAARWYHSMYGDMSKLYQTRRAGSDLSAYRDIPEEADAYALGELVRDCLLEEWKLDPWKAPKLEMQHASIAG